MKKVITVLLVFSVMLVLLSCDYKQYECKVCGNKVQETDNFCSACGAEVQIPGKNEEEIEYTEVTLKALSEEWNQNKTRVEVKYLDQYVCIKGTVVSIGDDYEFTIKDRDPALFDLQSATCTVTKPQAKEAVLNLNKKDNVIIKGKITRLGSLLFGVEIEVDSIEIE